MPPPSNHPSLHLRVLPAPFIVVKISREDEVPGWALKGLAGTNAFLSITKTDEEISIVGESHPQIPDDVKESATWTCIKITGPMEHDLTGIMADFAAPLKAAKVPIFAISTWNTDYVLVPTEHLLDATSALRKDGWEFVQA